MVGIEKYDDSEFDERVFQLLIEKDKPFGYVSLDKNLLIPDQFLNVENVNRIIEITLNQLGATTFDQVNNVMVEKYINSQNFEQLKNENLYFVIIDNNTKITKIFDLTFDNTFE